MTRIISGALAVSSFDSTGNPGEYTITGAIYNSANDDFGNGAADLHTDMVLYVQASDINTFLPITGKVHRYKLVTLDIIDQETVNGTIIWDEPGDEADTPTNGSTCVIVDTTENKHLGFNLPMEFYPNILPGMLSGIANCDLAAITDREVSGGPSATFKYVQSLTSATWTIVHGRSSRDFVYTIFDDTSSQVWPNDVEILDDNRVIMHFLEGMKGKVVFNFV